jgi:hypothetical protein
MSRPDWDHPADPSVDGIRRRWQPEGELPFSTRNILRKAPQPPCGCSSLYFGPKNKRSTTKILESSFFVNKIVRSIVWNRRIYWRTSFEISQLCFIPVFIKILNSSCVVDHLKFMTLKLYSIFLLIVVDETFWFNLN